ncbi:hypothetical protein BIT28_09050 [Photobacterium proteolyticum]|uniref:Molybdenum cofactor biosynthesis protein n=1 Tax=Photobacterium proteolyticum TaxID=1903952 RepID=A0A1Q9GIV7_9GAMM|nr:hypothetical protein [Photobacterium proteolyticum]OLQ74389.1 hypothetical protein BIT28_09050 [Photobacterium proteolyticum]
MDVNRGWGLISILLGVLSLLWGGVSLGGMLGQEQVFSDMNQFLAAGGGDLLSSFSAEHAIAEAKNKNVVIISTGIVLSLFGMLMMRGQLDKF